LAARRRTA